MDSKRVVAVRKALGLNRKQFSEKIGIPYATLQAVEQGIRDMNLKMSSALADLGVNLNWVISGKGDMWLADANRDEGVPADIAELNSLAYDLDERFRSALLENAHKLAEIQKKIFNPAILSCTNPPERMRVPA